MMELLALVVLAATLWNRRERIYLADLRLALELIDTHQTDQDDQFWIERRIIADLVQ
jgi:hypothetical protein